MKLNLGDASAEGDDFIEYIKYNATSGRWYIKADSDGEIEVKQIKAFFDLQNLQLGWMGWLTTPEGTRPHFAADPSLEEPSEKPADGYKRASRITMLFGKKTDLGVRQWTCDSISGKDGVQQLYSDYWSKREDNKGVPIVEFVNTKEKKNSRGNINHIPVFEITGWKERPDELTDAMGDEQDLIKAAGEDILDDEF